MRTDYRRTVPVGEQSGKLQQRMCRSDTSAKPRRVVVTLYAADGLQIRLARGGRSEGIPIF